MFVKCSVLNFSSYLNFCPVKELCGAFNRLQVVHLNTLASELGAVIVSRRLLNERRCFLCYTGVKAKIQNKMPLLKFLLSWTESCVKVHTDTGSDLIKGQCNLTIVCQADSVFLTTRVFKHGSVYICHYLSLCRCCTEVHN